MDNFDSKNGFSLRVYKGSQMTMLAMNLEKKPAGSFAGFSLGYTNPKGKQYYIMNSLNLEGVTGPKGSDESPIQLFKWVHFPGSYQQSGVLTGKYIYEATPRYLDADGKLIPLDPGKTVKVPVDVEDYSEKKVSIGFTRAFLKSQAFANRFDANQKLYPDGDWIFNTNNPAGKNKQFGPYTYEDMYAWLGFNARKMIYEMLDEAIRDSSISVDMFAYDFSDPVVAEICLCLSSMGRIKIILDNAALHAGEKKDGPTREDDFENRFNEKAKGHSEIYRCKFGRYSHCKIIILRKGEKAYKVLTGSTNFSSNGLYVNANHVLLYDNEEVAGYYDEVFNACWKNGTKAKFIKTPYASKDEKFTSSELPVSSVNFSPHCPDYAEELIDSITDSVIGKDVKSVLFSIMDLGEKSTGSLIKALRLIHKNDSIFTYGVTDNCGKEISLYKPGKKTGILINAKSSRKELPPTFAKEHSLPGHAIHHKFIVKNFNMDSARVYCGSSNLALGGESNNGDNLICIKNSEVATAFAIEAFRLTDHYNLQSLQDDKKKNKKKGEKQKIVKLDDTGKWVERFYNKNDIRYVERNILA
jgi:hypothetical protein